jgi:acetoin utilization deacetylase AcuC-like enzyme
MEGIPVKARSPTGLVFFPAFDWSMGMFHPEREERLLYTRDLLAEEGLLDHPGIELIAPQPIPDTLISGPHVCLPVIDQIATFAHRLAAGGVVELGHALMQNRIQNGFAAIRPPGHHAFRITYGNRGFCNINNVCILVHLLRTQYGIERIAVVDTDVHHGDGTQDFFWNDPDVLVISLHQDGRTNFPGTGYMEDLGGPTAFGTTLNIPLPPGAGDASYLHLISEAVKPIIDDFQPQIVLNSAGQDCHFSDPLGGLQVSARGYTELTKLLNPDLAVLEGGYSVESALPYIHLGMISALAGLNTDLIREPEYNPELIGEPEGCAVYVNHLITQVKSAYFNRNELREQVYPNTQQTRSRIKRIYYDEDGIVDLQKETLTLCDACPGFEEIRSKADFGSGHSVYTKVYIVPYQGCSRCREMAERLYSETISKSSKWNYVCLLDLINERTSVQTME